MSPIHLEVVENGQTQYKQAIATELVLIPFQAKQPPARTEKQEI